ncbi:MAG TPA: bifunctional folylpolyglutamate synthase/dihydrofolate synthase [Bacteroidetes bacterium]|nr:bifunctional folylpolyglutamate synthase/dihydrofolate synthase [Bacteroidota bacterium]
MFQRVGPKAFKKDLSNIVEICKTIGRPQNKFRSIHIAGTNGKGSVAHLLAAVFTAAGYRTGLYTSPHYKDFRERIKINGTFIPKKEITGFVSTNKSIFKNIKPSFFEWTVALAFGYFAKEKVDIAIIETGLGGRLDSTNIIQPLLGIITNIGYDHTHFLGETLPEIAGEKAGIIKKETPVVIGETHIETKAVFIKKAKESNAPISFADQFYKTRKTGEKENTSFYEIIKNNKIIFEKMALNHLGAYQKHNLPTLLQAIDVFNDFYENEFPGLTKSLEKGLANLKPLTNFMGRWEYISHSPRILVDSAHNTAGIKQAVEALGQIDFNNLHIVFGLVFDKSHDKVLSLLPKDASYYFAKANIPRGMDANKLKNMAALHSLNGKAYASVRKALAAAKIKAAKNDLIFVGGSIFVVAEVL